MTTTLRLYNFSAGPAVLPLTVLQEIQRDLVALPGVGMSILEISHRSKTFESILAQAAVARINLDGAPSDSLLDEMQRGNGDILDLHLVTI